MKCSGCGLDIIADGHSVCPYCGSALVVCGTGAVVTKKSNLSDGTLSGEQVFEQSIFGVLEISTECGSGSGFLISKDGYALTNTHVIVDQNNLPCRKVVVKLLDYRIPAKIIKMGDNKGGLGNGIDLAVLKLANVPEEAKPLILGDSKNVKIAEKVYAIGNSLGYGTCITSGIVSDNKRYKDRQMYIMTDCAVNHGNSGGPLLNSEGEVVGVLVRIEFNHNIREVADGMKYAIPSNDAIEFAEEYLQ